MRRLANVLVALIFVRSNALAGSLFPSDFDQYLLELTNRARRDPAGEAARYGISLNEGLGFPLDPSPRAPLSFDLHLVEAAMAHSRDMLDHNFFGHVSSDGKTAEDRARIAGYRAIAGIAENISWQGNTLAAPDWRRPSTTYIATCLWIPHSRDADIG